MADKDLERRVDQLSTPVNALPAGNLPPRPLPERETPLQKARGRLKALLDAEDARPEGEKQLWWNRNEAPRPEMRDPETVARDLDQFMWGAAGAASDKLLGLPPELQGGPAVKMWNTAQIVAHRLYRDDPRPEDIARKRFDEHMIQRIETKARAQAMATRAARIGNLPADSPRVTSAERRWK